MARSGGAAEPVGEVGVLTAPQAARSCFEPNATSVDAGFFTWEIASGDVVADPVTYQMHGLPETASSTMSAFLSRVPESDLERVEATIARITASCGAYQIDYRVIGEDGRLRSMEARGRVMPGPDGRPARMIGVVMDVTTIRADREAQERRLREEADRAHRTRELITAVASAVTVESIVAAAEDGLSAYGANGMIVIATRDNRLAVVASCGFDDEALTALSGLSATAPTPVSAAIGWRAPVYLGSPGAMAGDYPHLARIAEHGPQQAWVALPVPDARGQLGACVFGFPQPRDFPATERALLFAAAGLLAQSVERARMYEAEHALARELQRGMLPRGTLAAPGMTIATRYQPATSGLEIGGDFYDVIQLADGQVALAIGDVQGHNLLAASLMGRLRTAVHAYAREGHGPAEVMARANQWLADLNIDPDRSLFATCCFVVVNPASGELAMCRAGHPAPVLMTPGAPPRVLECEGGLPLGVDADAEYATIQARAEPGSVLLLTTDGLLESDAGDDHNLQGVIDTLARGADVDIEVLADDVLATPRRPSRHADDVALLLARLSG